MVIVVIVDLDLVADATALPVTAAKRHVVLAPLDLARRPVLHVRTRERSDVGSKSTHRLAAVDDNVWVKGNVLVKVDVHVRTVTQLLTNRLTSSTASRAKSRGLHVEVTRASLPRPAGT